MKKLLTILAAVGLTATSSISVIACDAGNTSPTKPVNKKDLTNLFTKTEISGYDFRDKESILTEMIKGVDVDVTQLEIQTLIEADQEKTGSFTIVPTNQSTKYKGEFVGKLTKWTTSQWINEEIKTANHFIPGLVRHPLTVENIKTQITENVQNEIWNYKAREQFKKENFDIENLLIAVGGGNEERELQDSDMEIPQILKVILQYSYEGIVEQRTNLFIAIIAVNVSTTRSNTLQAIKNVEDPDAISKEEWTDLWLAYSENIMTDIKNKTIKFYFPQEYAELRNDDSYIRPWQIDHLRDLIIKQITFIFTSDLEEYGIAKGYDPTGFSIEVNKSNFASNPASKTVTVTGISTITLIHQEEPAKYPIDFKEIDAFYNPII